MENPDSSADAIKDIEAQIKAYEIEEWSKAKIRVRNTIKEEGEKASKFFLNLEKQQVQNSKIDRLVNAEGKFIDQPHSMLDYANDFYSDLYKEEDISYDNLNDIISKISRKQIPHDIHCNLEKAITADEVKLALFQMNKNKSPGLDGLTVEFYQTFRNTIASDVLKVYNCCFKNGILCRLMNSALIRLIYKNRGERTDLKNWRPISLLTVDYKILSKVITNRMKLIMPLLVGEEQTCGVVGRNIHDNLMVLRDTIDYVELDNSEAALISIDQEKAFDRISWKYLFTVLTKMGIPSNLIKWIKLLYSNPNCNIIVNNFIGSPVKVSRWIRQGSPLSPLLYSICAEGLASLARTDCDLKGIVTPGGESSIRLIQHADDITFFIGDNKEFVTINNILSTYCKGSGSKLNVDKSKGMWLGKWTGRVDKPCNFQWCDKLKILGIIFGNDVVPNDNWGPRITKIRSTLDKWSKRNLTYHGKSVIVNILIGPCINYLGSVLTCPEETVKKMNSMIWNFFWDGKIEKIKRATIIGPKD